MSSKSKPSNNSNSHLTPDTFKQLLKKLVQTPDDFSADDVTQAFEHLVISGQKNDDGKLLGATEAQIGGFLTALTLSGLDSSPEVISACAKVLRAHSVQLDNLLPSSEQLQPTKEKDPYSTEKEEEDKDRYFGLVDIVGTGGDGHDTFNVSTTAAVVCAGVEGVRVAKVSQE